MTQIWPIRALGFLGHSDWFTDGEMTQLEPIRSNESFTGAAGKMLLSKLRRFRPEEAQRSGMTEGAAL